jgi:DNA-binding CsgD family transcriptional regulator
MGSDLGAADARGAGFTLVGRDRELGTLVRALQDLPAVVMIEGEGGAGKSRLVREAARALAAGGTRVLTGLCYPLREPFPFGPVVQGLRGAAAWLPEATLLPPQAGALSSLLPELVAFLPAGPQRAEEPRMQRFALMQAVRVVLEAVGPTVLVVEDLHWADEATRELLFLLASDPPKNCGLVLTFREEDLPAGMPVLGSAYRRPQGVGGAEIPLRTLSEPDITRWAVSVLGDQAAGPIGRVLYERSAGLPLVVEEDLFTLVEQRGRTPVGGPAEEAESLLHAEVPRGLREAVHERLGRLSASAVTVVEAAAVLGVPADQQMLTDLAGVGPEEGTLGLTDALRGALLRETEPGRYGFRHVLAQQTVYRSLLGPRRLALHGKAVEVLRGQDSPPLVQIAHHTRALGDMKAWLREAEAAADQAVALGDDGIATKIIHDILDQPRADPQMRSRVALALADIAHKATRYAASADTMRRILADPRLPLQTRGRVRLALATLMINQAGDASGFRENERAIEELAPWPALAATAMVGLIRYERQQSPSQIEGWVERAERVLEGSDDKGAHAAVRGARLILMARRGDAGVWDLVDALPRDSADPQVRRQTAVSLYTVANFAMVTGQDERAAPLLEDCLHAARQEANPSLECYTRTLQLRLSWLSGRWSDVEERFRELEAEFPDMRITSTVRALICGTVAASRGQWAQSLKHFEFAAAAGEREPGAVVAIQAAAGTAAVQLVRGEPEAAWKTVAPAVDLLRSTAAWHRTPVIGPPAVQAAMACGKRRTAELLVAEAEAARHERIALGRAAPAADAELHKSQGLLLRDSDPAAAAGHFSSACALWQQIGRPYPAAQNAEWNARTLAATEPRTAAARLAEAAESFVRLGATSDAARCRQTLRDAGFARPSSRGRRGYGDQLSPRETEVVQLLAAGATNHDIAQALFLSVRTVEHHVARAMKKLGMTRREDVADALRDHGPSHGSGNGPH